MEWIDIKSDILIHSYLDILKKLTAANVIKILSISIYSTVILFKQSVFSSIVSHLSSSNNEQGGLLLGNVYKYKKNSSFVNDYIFDITCSVQSKNSSSTHTFIKMDSSIWKQAACYINKGNVVIGWYHSHPGFGAFFSSTDRKTQHNFFYHDYSLGLCIDPVNNDFKFFQSEKSNSIKFRIVRYK